MNQVETAFKYSGKTERRLLLECIEQVKPGAQILSLGRGQRIVIDCDSEQASNINTLFDTHRLGLKAAINQAERVYLEQNNLLRA
ncbi:hypothetical protein AAFM81_002510 [Vibrio fluvialis]